jgi:hypothetical protein
LALFDEYKTKFNKIPPSTLLTQALKACQKLGDFKRGYQIIEEYSSQLNLDDNHLVTSIIHLFSKLGKKKRFYLKIFSFILVQSGHVDKAQRIFDQSSHKSMGMYGVMMKGQFNSISFSQILVSFFFRLSQK